MSREFAVVCPGQGSQSPDMFDLALSDPRGRAVLDEFSDSLNVKLVSQARASVGLFDNAFAQPALVAAALATWAALEPRLPPPSLFAGYSVGEVSSWGCAKAWSVRACAQAVDARARIMDEDSPPGCGMLAVLGLRRERVKALCPELHVAIVNDVDHVVLAGSETLLSASAAVLASHGASTRRLEVKVPSHTQLLAHAAGRFGALLAELPMADPALPVLRGIDGHRCLTALQGRSALRDAISHSIRWDECRREIEQSGMRVVLELGPGRSLSRLFLATEEGLLARSVSDFRTLDGVAVWLSKQLEG